MDKPTAWYDPSNGVVSTDRDCPLFTPLGQVWPLSPKREWVGLTDEEIAEVEDEYIVDYRIPAGSAWNFAKDIEAKLKEKNT
jgi:hypothetical protein